MATGRTRLTALLVLVGVMLVGAAPGAEAAGGRAGVVTAAKCRSGLRPSAAGPHTITVDGVERSYLLALPRRYDGRTRVPMIFDFHGFNSSGTEQELNTRMGARGAARGFVVVTPTALGNPRQWNAFDAPSDARDYAFVDALLTQLEQQLCVDPGRVFAAGHSNGSAFAAILVCKAPYRFAGVAMVSATTPSICPTGVTPPALAIAGTADASVPYAGGTVAGSSIRIPAAEATMLDYSKRYGCAPTSLLTQSNGVDRTGYSRCRGRSAVVLYSVRGGTHPWPGGVGAAADPADSAAGRTFDATGAILRFFGRQRWVPPGAAAG